MKKIKTNPLVFVVILSIVLSACSPLTTASRVLSSLSGTQNNNTQPQIADQQATPVTVAPVSITQENSLIGAYEGTLEAVYEKVSPSVVNIQVTADASTTVQNLPFSFQYQNPSDQQQAPQTEQRTGSGFVWDKSGHVITNNHVIDGAQEIFVKFPSGISYPATVIGADLNSDLAVLKVDEVTENELYPVQVADSTQVKVGQIAIAIGNPFGLEGTMTVGIISALGRSLNVDNSSEQTGSYTIPDIIQTDAPINPGNSGGVLVNDLGQVIGVTAAIESTTQASAGIGFVIPSAIIEKVIPTLIEKGKFEYPWLGISGVSLTRKLNDAINLDPTQQGVLVMEVIDQGPADKAGLMGSTEKVTIDGQEVNIGGDIITAIDDTTVKEFDDLVTYLVYHTSPGQTVELSILRDNKPMTIQVDLSQRPSS